MLIVELTVSGHYISSYRDAIPRRECEQGVDHLSSEYGTELGSRI